MDFKQLARQIRDGLPYSIQKDIVKIVVDRPKWFFSRRARVQVDFIPFNSAVLGVEVYFDPRQALWDADVTPRIERLYIDHRRDNMIEHYIRYNKDSWVAGFRACRGLYDRRYKKQ